MTIENPENLNILENSSHENPNSFIEAEEVVENKESKKSFREKTSEKIKELRDKISGSFSKKPDEGKESLSEEELVSKKASQIGLKLEEFETNADWKSLSNGQKMLALEQMSQNTLLNVKQIGEERFAQKLKESGFWGKIRKNIRKSYFISQEEKQVLEEVREGKISPDQNSSEIIIKHLKDLKLDTYIGEFSGKPFIEFAKSPENCPEELSEKLHTYNELANEFSKIPARFGDPHLASKSEKKKFKEAQKKFEEAQKELINEQSKFDSEFTVLDNIAVQEFKVRALQSKLEHPDAFKGLDKIENELSYGRFFNNENTWKAMYAGGGFLLRKGATGALGLAAAPAVAGVVGIFRGLRNGNKKIKDAYQEGRSTETRLEKKERLENLENELRDEQEKFGTEDFNQEKVAEYISQIEEIKNGKEKTFTEKVIRVALGEKKKGIDVDAFVNVDDLNNRLDRLKKKFQEYENSNNETKKAEKYFELIRRIDFINKKYQDGLINFGTKNPVSEKYELLKKIADIQTFTDPYKTIDGIKYRLQKDGSTKEVLLSEETKDFNKKLKKQQEKINNKFQNKKIKIEAEEVGRGVANAILFSSLAVGIREWYQGSESQEFINDSFRKGAEVVGGTFKDASYGYQAFKAWIYGVRSGVETVDNKNINITKILKNISDQQNGVSSEENQNAFKKAFEESNRSEDVEGVYKEKTNYISKSSNEEVVAKEVLKDSKQEKVLTSSLALVKKGDGVTNPLARQIEEILKDPEQAKTLGFDGENAHKFAIKKAAELAKEYGYIKPDGSEVRLGTNSIGHASYEVKMANGKLIVNETFDGKDMTEGNIDKEYEYSYKKEVKVSTPSEEEIAKVPTNKSNIKPNFKFLQDKNNLEWIEAGKPTVDGETKLAQDIIKDEKSNLGKQLKQYHDYVKAETGKDIAVKSDDTAETYKKSLDEALRSSGKSIPTETIEESKTEVSDIEKTGAKKINPNELIGKEKLVELDKLQEKTLKHFDENFSELENKIKSKEVLNGIGNSSGGAIKNAKELKEMMTPSDSNHIRIVLKGSGPTINLSSTMLDRDYINNGLVLHGDPKNFSISIEGDTKEIKSSGSISYFGEVKNIKEIAYEKDSKGNYNIYRIVEIEKPQKFTPSESITPPEKVTPPLTKDSELKLK